MNDITAILQDIRKHDPAGGLFRPTEAAEAAFRTWVLDTYGLAVHDRYFRGYWDVKVTD